MSGAPVCLDHSAGFPDEGDPMVQVSPVARYSVQAEDWRPREGQCPLPIFRALAVIPDPYRDSEVDPSSGS